MSCLGTGEKHDVLKQCVAKDVGILCLSNDIFNESVHPLTTVVAILSGVFVLIVTCQLTGMTKARQMQTAYSEIHARPERQDKQRGGTHRDKGGPEEFSRGFLHNRLAYHLPS